MEVTPLIGSLMVVLVLIIALLTIDDLFIDFYAWIFRIKPSNIAYASIDQSEQKKIAIMIANWHEDNILEQMIVGNNASIIYNQHHFFLGVYPNDEPTLKIAQNLSQKFSNVHCIVNEKNGPTSKGQMMNSIVNQILLFEASAAFTFDLFVIHDSEDIIHPLSMKLYNHYSDQLDFIQIPIFSLNRDSLQLTAGTYMDEFAEMHTKELLVRDALGAAIPSAGVGTCLSRKLVLYVQQLNGGHFLVPESLTEDYILGWQAHLHHFRCGFICKAVTGFSDKPEIIATKEYFPQDFFQSIRQKTRWTIGIAFQGRQILGWTNSMINNYFLFRDRRGPLNSVVIFCSLVIFIIGCLKSNLTHQDFSPVILAIGVFNLIGLFIRLFQRLRSHGWVYNARPAHIMILRWPVATVINAFAAFRALYQYTLSAFGLKKLKWSKTQHTLPKEFGQTA